MFTAKGPKCCVLEGSPRYRGGTVVQFALVRLVKNNWGVSNAALRYKDMQ